MNIMRQLFCTIVVIVIFGHVGLGQEISMPASQVQIFKAHIINNRLELNWQVNKSESNKTSWIIEGSRDGRIFKTIGYVWGSENGSCIFKQNVSQLQKGLKFYRVLSVQDENFAIASQAIKI